MTIWKFPLVVTDTQYVQMPEHAQILSVANQDGQLCLWAMVDPKNVTATRRIEIFGTGNPVLSRPHIFIGTVLMGQFVWHVFEQLNEDWV